jgi:NAD(P)-dependent dehydrogenase (short-subunit alcohol dehydrogenase family)
MLAGRIAVITGGTRGLGRAIAERLATEGAITALIYQRDEASAKEAVAAIPGAQAFPADIGSSEEIAKVIEAITTGLGPIEILVNNAFRSGRKPVKTHELEIAAWDEDLRTNLSGQFYTTRACLPSMIDRGFGRIVFIGSLAMRGEQGRVAYSVAKQALIGLSNTVAQEYAKHGITSNVVSPGFIQTGAFMRLSHEIRDRALAMVPSKRAGSPAHVAGLVAHLCSEEGGYTNGQVISVDGGAR